MHLGLIEAAIALLGIGFGLGGLARIRSRGERGPGDRLSCWGLILCGVFLALHGLFAWQGWIDWP